MGVGLRGWFFRPEMSMAPARYQREAISDHPDTPTCRVLAEVVELVWPLTL